LCKTCHGARHLKKNNGILCKGSAVTYAWIDEHKAIWPVSVTCAAPGISKSGYYATEHRAESQSTQKRVKRKDELSAAIKQQSMRHKQRYGRPRMTDQLKKLGFSVNHRRVGKEMKRIDLQHKPRCRHKICTTDSQHGYGIAPNILERRFTQEAPNKAWAADITYIHTAEGWLFAALSMDLFSKKSRLGAG
jgi:putative transposase